MNLLDLLREEVTRRSATGTERPALCPTAKFRTVLEHRLVCPRCKNTSCKKEPYNHFSVDLPTRHSGATEVRAAASQPPLSNHGPILKPSGRFCVG